MLPSEEPVRTLYIDETTAERQLARVDQLRHERDNGKVGRTLDRLRVAATGEDNLMYSLLEAVVRAYATIGEMCDALREVWGEYEEVPAI